MTSFDTTPRSAHSAVSGEISSTFALDVSERIRAHLDCDEPVLRAHLARHLRTSERTLCRRLREAGTSFALLLDDARRAKLRDMTQGGQRRRHDLAPALGYRSVRGLQLALRRWRVRVHETSCEAT